MFRPLHNPNRMHLTGYSTALAAGTLMLAGCSSHVSPQAVHESPVISPTPLSRAQVCTSTEILGIVNATQATVDAVASSKVVIIPARVLDALTRNHTETPIGLQAVLDTTATPGTVERSDDIDVLDDIANDLDIPTTAINYTQDARQTAGRIGIISLYTQTISCGKYPSSSPAATI